MLWESKEVTVTAVPGPLSGCVSWDSLSQAALQSWGWKLSSSSLLFLRRVLATSYLSRTPLCAPSFLWVCYQCLLEPRTLPDTWQVPRQDLGRQPTLLFLFLNSLQLLSLPYTCARACARACAHTHTESQLSPFSLWGVCVHRHVLTLTKHQAPVGKRVRRASCPSPAVQVSMEPLVCWALLPWFPLDS